MYLQIKNDFHLLAFLNDFLQQKYIFGSFKTEDRVELFGSEGKIIFSIFDNTPLRLETVTGVQELSIENPKNIQLHHVQNMRKHLFEDNYLHPSTGESATHVSWVMDKILGKL